MRTRTRFVTTLLAATCAGLVVGCAGSNGQAAIESDSIGSTRHSTVAMETDGGRRPVTVLAGSLDDNDLDALRAEHPNLRIITPESNEDALRLAPDVHGADGRYCSAEFVQAATQLRWVQSPSAGVERYINNEGIRSNPRIVLTNMQGVHGPTIAEHSFGMLLALTRDIRYFVQPEQQGTWNRGGSGAETISLKGRTLLVVGLGGIGSEIARIGHGMGMHVLATRRSTTPPPPTVDEQGTPDQLREFLARADVVALAVPLTDETRGMIGAAELELMKPGSYLINIARGPVVETDALVASLRSGHLAGACLDVTDPEPLPAGHPLWSMDNVVITPHMSSRSELTSDQWRTLYLENLGRFAKGQPLLNVVDKSAGY